MDATVGNNPQLSETKFSLVCYVSLTTTLWSGPSLVAHTCYDASSYLIAQMTSSPHGHSTGQNKTRDGPSVPTIVGPRDQRSVKHGMIMIKFFHWVSIRRLSFLAS